MRRNRIQILVEVNTDPVPGWGNDPHDYVKHIERLLNDTIPHYKPVVTLIEMPTDDRDLPARETTTSGP